MALYTILSGRTKQELLDQLNGVLVGTVNLAAGADVNTLTLVFTAPAAATVTFADANTVSLADIVAEINSEAGLAGVASIKTIQTGSGTAGKHPTLDRRLILTDPAGTGVTLTIGSSTGAAALGFDAGNGAGVVVPSAKIVSNGDNVSGHYWVLVAP